MNVQLDLASAWFLLVGVLLTGYAVLDGFDLGVGSLHLLTRGDSERRTLLNAIGPVWDGNEVWLLAGGGALFAAFPDVYATVFSGFYTALMLFLMVAILRAVSLEFRSKATMPWWPKVWDTVFAVTSTVMALLLGVALGNIARGIPIDADREFAGSFLGLLNPYALVVGLTTVALFVTHGGIYLQMKTEGALLERIQGQTQKAHLVLVALFVVLTVFTVVAQPHLVKPFQAVPALLAVPLLVTAALGYVPIALRAGRPGRAFVASATAIGGLMLTLGLGLYSRLVPSLPHPQHTLTIYNASSSPKTLTTMLIIALVGMPLVIGYTIFIYRIFKGKVRLDDHSY